MLLNNITPLSYYVIKNSKTASANAFPGRSLVCSPSCSLNVKTPLSSLATPNYQNVEDSIERIREAFGKKVHELSASSYDTAWVAMVPSLETPNKPYFPQCLDWIMEHQQKDGSWGPNPIHPSLVKDSLSCTLACLLALRKWAVGEDLVQRGLEFIGSNLRAANDKDQFSPIGFDITFPNMINYAKKFELVLPLDPAMYLNKDMEIQRRNGNLAYIAEGLGESHNWEEVLLAQQRSNGSLFNSPATTAAALIHCHNEKCLEYLHSILQTYKGWVPTVYPSTIYTRLCMIDTLERLGVGRYFKQEIERVLDETYRCWQQKDEEIFTDVTCFALAFRLLRVKGYEVTSDDFEAYSDQENFFNTASLQFTGATTVLELFRASQFKLYKKEGILDQIQAWTSMFLKQQLLNQTILDKRLHEQVKFTLKNFHGILDRLGYRRNIDLYDINEFQILKTSYRCPSIDNKDFLVLAQHDFNMHNAVHQKDLQELERWYKNNRLDCLKFGRRVLQTAYFLIASLLSGPELSEARISYAQCVILVTLIDDFFDDYGSREELLNIVELVKKWDEQPPASYSCEEVEILFSALFSTVNEMAAKGAIKQGRRRIKHVLLKQWLDLIEGFMKEWEWWNEKITPTMDEYLSFTHTTIGCKVSILTTIHFLGPKFSEDMISSEECTSLCWHVSLIARLLNDIQTYKKESAENSPNIVAMQVAQNQGSIAKDEIVAKIQDMVEESRRKLLQIVFQKQGSLVPKECKDLFWGTGKIGHYLYCQGGDEFTSPDEMIKDMKAVIYEQFKLLNSAA